MGGRNIAGFGLQASGPISVTENGPSPMRKSLDFCAQSRPRPVFYFQRVCNEVCVGVMEGDSEPVEVARCTAHGL